MKKAAIYCRVSTDSQEIEGTSLDSQLEACLKKAQERGFEVPKNFIISETYSGLTLDRPKLSELRQWVRDKEVDAVIAYTLDRLSRDPVHFIILQEELERAGVTLMMVTEDVDSSDMGKLISHIKGYAAKLEVEKIRERTMRGKKERAKGGRLLGGRGLYGYNYVPGKGVGEGIRYVNEEQTKWVRDMYRWFVEEGLTVNGIVYRLRALGVPTPSGNSYWGQATVYRILTHPGYIGKTYAFTQSRVEADKHVKPSRKNKATHIVLKPREEWVEIPNATPAIISEELFNQVQVKLQRNSQLSPRNTKNKYLLRGYVFCKLCGRRYYGMTVPQHKGEIVRRRYYRCPKVMKIVSPEPCGNRSWNADRLEAIVWEKIEKVLTSPQIVMAGLRTREQEIAKLTSYKKELEGIEAQLSHRQKQKDRVWKAFRLTGDEDKFRSEIREVEDGIRELERRREEIERRIQIGRQAELDIGSIEKFCEIASQNLADFTFGDKRLALEALSIKVWVDNDHVTIEGAIPTADVSIASPTSWRNRHCHQGQW